MKKTLLMLFAAVAFVGCERAGEKVDEPAGAEPNMQTDTNTNTLSDPSGASPDQSGAGAGPQQNGTSGADTGDAKTP